jgi:hypothetical protein
VSKESRDFLLLIYRHQRKNTTPINATPPTIPPIKDPTLIWGLEDIFAAAAAEDCAGPSPACVDRGYPIVGTSTWLEYMLWIVEACVMLASVCATAEGVFDACLDEDVGLPVGMGVDNIVWGTTTTGSVAEAVEGTVAWVLSGLDVACDGVEVVDCVFAGSGTDTLVDWDMVGSAAAAATATAAFEEEDPTTALTVDKFATVTAAAAGVVVATAAASEVVEKAEEALTAAAIFGIAVHRFPPIDVIEAPAGRDMVKRQQTSATKKRKSYQTNGWEIKRRWGRQGATINIFCDMQTGTKVWLKERDWDSG